MGDNDYPTSEELRRPVPVWVFFALGLLFCLVIAGLIFVIEAQPEGISNTCQT